MIRDKDNGEFHYVLSTLDDQKREDDKKRQKGAYREFVSSDGKSGYFLFDCYVYNRAGQPCRVCDMPVRQMVQQQRSTFYCLRCQR